MAKFITIGERLSTTAPSVNKAFTERDPEPILKRAKQQLDAGAVYLDVNIGPAENDGEDLMKWAVKLLRLQLILPIRKLSRLVFLYITEAKENRSLTPQMLAEESRTSTLQQQTMLSLSLFAPLTVLQQTMMSV